MTQKSPFMPYHLLSYPFSLPPCVPSRDDRLHPPCLACAGTGLSINPMNTVVGLAKGSIAVSDGLVHVGDIITKVNGIPVSGASVLSAMDGAATSYAITLLREKGDPTADSVTGCVTVESSMSAPVDSPPPGSASAGSAPRAGHAASGSNRSLAGRRGGTSASALHGVGLGGDTTVDLQGWLTKVKSLDGRAIRLPEKRWVVLQGTTLSWYKDSQCEHEANSQVCAIIQKIRGLPTGHPGQGCF